MQPPALPLSAAIRLGAMLRPQGRGQFLRDGKTCALGAALDAVGELALYVFVDGIPNCDQVRTIVDGMPYRWPVLREFVQHPISPTWNQVPLASVIVDLNDTHKQTREQIADFVESVEREVEAKLSRSAEGPGCRGEPFESGEARTDFSPAVTT